MAKNISRTIERHIYHFGTIDVENGTVHLTEKVERVIPFGKKAIDKFCKEHDVVFCKHETSEALYSLPIEEFVTACERYAQNQDQLEITQ